MTSRGAALAIGWALCSSCHPPSRPAEDPAGTTADPPERKAIRLPLQDYLSGAGVRYLLNLHPKALLQVPGLRQDWLPLLGTERLAAYSSASGIDPERVEQIWIAGYDFGTLMVIDGTEVGQDIESAFRRRALTTRDVETDTDLVHVTGIIEKRPHALVRIPGHAVIIADGDVSLARAARARAEGQLRDVPSALQVSALTPHREFRLDAPLRIFFVGPFEEATDVVVQGATDGVAAVVVQDGRLEVEARVRGAWPPLADLGSRIDGWAQQILATSEMKALGWAFFEERPEIRCEVARSDRGLSLCQGSGTWRSKAIADSLYRIVAAPTQEMLDGADLPRRGSPSDPTAP